MPQENKAGMGHASVIPAFGRRRQDDEFKITLSYLKGEKKCKKEKYFKMPLLQNNSEESILDAS